MKEQGASDIIEVNYKNAANVTPVPNEQKVSITIEAARARPSGQA